jgi:RND family efflux transporter MFP subunit
MKSKPYIMMAAAGAVAVVILASASLRRPAADQALVEVRRGDLEVWTPYEGTIQSRTVRGISSQVGGGATLIELVPEGTAVTQGMTLVRVDASGLERDLVRLERDLALARAEYEGLVSARIPLERREVEMRLLQATSEKQDAEAALADVRELVDEGLVPGQDAVQQEKKTSLLRMAVENLEQQVALTRDHLHPSAIERARAQRDASEQEWTMARQQLEQTVVVAPSDGVVVYQPVAVGSEFRPVRVGDTVFKNQVFMILSDMSDLIVVFDVPEHELTLARIGRPVVVSPVSYPGMTLSGEIESVGAMAQLRADRPGRQKYFQVNVRLLDAPADLRSGMTARLHVCSHERKNVVLVPRAAIAWERQDAYARVLGESGPRRVPVRLGIAGHTEVEVLAGLQPGQRIVAP